MASGHNVVFLLDTADWTHRNRVRLSSLRLLNYLGCRFGPDQVRWGCRYFDSSGARPSKPNRMGDFQELGPRGWLDFEEELEARFEAARGLRVPRGRGSRAAFTQSALKEILFDYQWDRPDITSPAKPPQQRTRRAKRLALQEEPREIEPVSEGFIAAKSRNAIFLFSACPRSSKELLHFVADNDKVLSSQQVMDRLLPKSVQDMITNKKITLYWVDTTEWSKVWDSPDHVGYWTILELIQLVGGSVLPSETLILCSRQYMENQLHNIENISLNETNLESSKLQVKPYTTDLPFDSVLNRFIYSDLAFRALFPQQEGVLVFMAHGVEWQWNCMVELEPIIMNQRYLRSPVKITLKGTVKDGNYLKTCSFNTDSWVLYNSKKQDSEQAAVLFHQLVKRLAFEDLHMVADVSTCEDLSPSTGILSPVSDTVAVLTVVCNEKAVGLERLFSQAPVTESTEEIASDLPDIVNSVLNHIYKSAEDDLAPTMIPVPEWAQQELARSNRWSSSVVEGWYPFSQDRGASSSLMETFRLLQSVSADEKEESWKSAVDLTNCLSELYQRKSSDESSTPGHRVHKRCGMPRTPVRQKMKTMSRSLQMLNVARLNVKAQKFQQDGLPPSANERGSQKQSKRRSTDKLEEKGKSVKSCMDFKTENEMISYLNDDYQKTVAEGDASLSLCAHSAIAVIKAFLKSQSTEKLEVECMDTVRNYLLKTSKTIRQQFGKSQDKGIKVRECEVQVFLRLEMCVQCPSVQNNTDDMEQMVEEITDMLRVLSLMEDPAYLTKFLEEVLTLYTASIPKILGDLYFSLGIQIPKTLASALPAEFFSNDSITHEEKSPFSQPLLSRAPSATSVHTEADQLEELRTRSAKKRRASALARHRSITESSQNLRQIELPKVPKRRPSKENSHSYLTTVVEKLQQLPLSLPLKEAAGQEVTKVRRNLFIQEICSPSKRSAKMPRSQSVSAVEGLKEKRSRSHESTKALNHHKLLTKKVTETPLHKQVSKRLLQKQIKGRCLDSASDFGFVEESPEKIAGDMELRRSPRIKQQSLSRRHSSSFYSCSQPKSQNLGRVHSASLQQKSSEQKDNTFPADVQAIKSPKSLLFGAVLGMSSSPSIKQLRKNPLVCLKPIVYQSPGKSPSRATRKLQSPKENRMLRKSSRLARIPQSTQNTFEKTPLSPPVRKTAAKSLGKYFSASKAMDQSFKFSGTRNECLAQRTPGKDTFSKERISLLLNRASELQSPEKREGAETFHVLSSSGTPQRVLNAVAIPVRSRPSTPCTPSKIQELQTESSHSVRTPQKHPLSSTLVTQDKCLQAEKLILKIQRTPDKSCMVASHVPGVIPNVNFPSTPRSPKDASDCLTPSKINNILPLENSNTLKSPSRKVLIDSLSRVQSREPIYAFCGTPKKSSKTENIVTVSSQKSLKILLSPRKILENSTSQTKIEENVISFQQLQAFKDRKQHDLNKNISLSDNFIFHTSKLSDDLSFVAEGLSPRKNVADLEETLSFQPTTKHSQASSDVILVHERLDSSSLTNSGTSESQTEEESIDISEARVLSAEESGLKMKLLITRKPSITKTVNSLSVTPRSVEVPKDLCSPTYELRCTPDRRQRQAAARLGTTNFTTKFSTPKSQRKLVPAVTPTYEVELEMQASGLPKLRIKRTDSNTALDVVSKKKSPTPKVLHKHKGDESPFSDPNGMWCSRHAGKVESTCVSPSCFRSSHSTPGKSGLQTYICQSYTPTRCVSTTNSPSHPDVGIPWTPSPKPKEKVTADAIKNWPRRKRAAAAIPSHSVGKSEKNDEFRDNVPIVEEGESVSEHHSNKNMVFGEFELEGVCRLQDQSPNTEWEVRAEESTSHGIFGLKSRKRRYNYSSPEKIMHPEYKKVCTRKNEDLNLAKRSCIEQSTAGEKKPESFSISKSMSSSNKSSTQHISLGDDDVFINEGLTPNKTMRGSLSASGLLALTQSPLLYQGKTPTSRKGVTDNELDFGTPTEKTFNIPNTAGQGESPFSSDLPRRSIIRTYSRKKLLS
ncbi:treslin [Rhinatrema bivittatum]|uniref:treslin n=1 Tax=Rhinatrema bivittatum TaxID=194408 RepID=UPI00112C6730|nr:treslin [Rhinatrema bivittatum]